MGFTSHDRVTFERIFHLYLRKFLTCPICGHRITGALSRGRGGKQYAYYYCNYDHTHVKAKAEEANLSFAEFVDQLRPNSAILALYNEILLDIRGEKVKENRKEADKLQSELDKLYERINRVNDLFFDGEISKIEKEKNIARYQHEAEVLRERIAALRLSADLKIKEKLTFSINLIANIGNFFRTAAPEVKIRVVGSIFPKNLEFDGKKYRIRQLNNLVHVIFHETKRLQGKAKVEPSENSEDSTWVPPLGLEPGPSEPESEILSFKLQGHSR